MNKRHRARTLAQWIALVFLVLAALPGPALAQSTPESIPAPLPGTSPTATVNLSPNTGYISQSVAVTGQTSVPAPSVRIMWVYGDGLQTVTAAVVSTSGNGYNSQVSVPLDAKPGPAQVCATVTNSASARLTCADFTVIAPPAGSVSGQAPANVVGAGATFHLLDRAGQTVVSAAIASSGSFQLSNVAPGQYQGAVEGSFSQLLRVGDVIVSPGDPTIAQFSGWGDEKNLDGSACLFGTDAKVTQLSGTPSHLNSDGIVDLESMSVVKRSMVAGLYKGPTPKPKPGSTYDFGLYLSGVPLTVAFEAYAQRKGGAAIERVEYYTQIGNAAPVLIGSATAKPWKLQYNVGQLAPGQTKLIAVPVVNGQQQCVTTKIIQVLADPMKNPKFQPGASTVWDSNIKAYHFWGTMPNVGGLLPANFDTPSLPMIGVLENRLGAGVYVEGWLFQDGKLWLGALDAQAYARLMSIDIFNKTLDLDPGGKLLAQWIKPQDLAAVSHQTPRYSLASFRQELTLFNAPLFAYPPWVVVRASISIGVAGDVSLSAVVQPLKPGIDVELRPSVSAWLGLTLSIDILFGIAGAEGTVQPGVTVALPLHLDPDRDPPVWFNDPCLTVFVRLIIRGRFLFWSWTIADDNIVNEQIPKGCNAQQVMAKLQSATAAAAPAASSTVEAPSVATDPGGRMLMVYIEDAGGTTPSPRVMARFKAAGNDQWDTAIPVTDGSRSVSDPVVAFAGPANLPLVAWTQNTLPPQASSPLTGDLGEALKRQEIYAATWDGSAWSTPVALTNDAVGDGRPAIAGDALGATLAWTRDTDGDLTTRSDQRITVREWTPISGGTGGTWNDLQLLGAAAAGGMNAQVSVARLSTNDPASGSQLARRILAWSFDADGDPNTVGDRRLAVATHNAAGDWSPQLLGELTQRADSPTVSLSLHDLDSAELAFLVRGKDGDGQTDIGPLSNRAQLWTAKYSFLDGSVSNAMPAADEHGATVYGERPRLTSTANGETLLAFRRFGQPDNNTWLGQIALAQRRANNSSYSAPLLLTDEPRQNWQAALAVNPANNQIVIAKIGAAPIIPVGAAVNQLTAQLAAQNEERFVWTTVAGQANESSLDILTVRPEADPALDDRLALSQVHAATGSTVTITATVRNLGRNAMPEASVCFYRGVPGSSVLIECRGVPPLNFNESRAVSVGAAAGSGAQPVYAEVVTGGENANLQNDRATADLGALPAPQALGVQEGTLFESSLAVKWQAVDVSGVAGYRILRSTQPGGPYEVVGEAIGSVFNDLPVQRGQTYYYVVQAYDGSGIVSGFSQELSGTLSRLNTFLPTVMH